MSKVYYEQRCDRFECVDVINDGSDTLSFIFDIPIDGKLVIGERTAKQIHGGVCKIKLSEIKEGECKPLVHKNGICHRLESINVGKGVSRKSPDDEYIRKLSGEVFSVQQRLLELSDEIAGLKTAINGKPII